MQLISKIKNHPIEWKPHRQKMRCAYFRTRPLKNSDFEIWPQNAHKFCLTKAYNNCLF